MQNNCTDSCVVTSIFKLIFKLMSLIYHCVVILVNKISKVENQKFSSDWFWLLEFCWKRQVYWKDIIQRKCCLFLAETLRAFNGLRYGHCPTPCLPQRNSAFTVAAGQCYIAIKIRLVTENNFRKFTLLVLFSFKTFKMPILNFYQQLNRIVSCEKNYLLV